MSSPSLFKLILNIDSFKYRVKFTSSSEVLSFKQFTQLIEQNYPQFASLNIFNQEKYIIEVYDKELEDFVRLEETDDIENLSSLRVVPLDGKLPLRSPFGSPLVETNKAEKGDNLESPIPKTSNDISKLSKAVNHINKPGKAVSFTPTTSSANKSDQSSSGTFTSTPTLVTFGGNISSKIVKASKKANASKESPLYQVVFKRHFDETNDDSTVNNDDNRCHKKIQITSANNKSSGKLESHFVEFNDKPKKTPISSNKTSTTSLPSAKQTNNASKTLATDLNNLCKDFKFNFAIDKELVCNPYEKPKSSNNVNITGKLDLPILTPGKTNKKGQEVKQAKIPIKPGTPLKPAQTHVTVLSSSKKKKKSKSKGVANASSSNDMNKQSSDELSGLEFSFDTAGPSPFGAKRVSLISDEDESKATSDDDSSASLVQPGPSTSSSKLLIDDYGRKQLTEDDFKLCNLKEKMKFIEIFTNYVRRFSPLNKNVSAWDADEIWDQILQELKANKIKMDPKTEFAHLLNQYIDIITHLCDWTELECNQLWPLFLKFHYELALTPFASQIDQLIKKFESHPKRNPAKVLGGPIQEPKKKLYHHHHKKGDTHNFNGCQIENRINYESNSKPSFMSNEILTMIGKKPLYSKNFAVDDFEKKRFVMDTLVNVLHDLSRDQIKAKDAVWQTVSSRLSSLGVNISAKKCRKQFNKLLDQYKLILTHLTDWTPEECQKLWCFFNAFHYCIDFSVFDSTVEKSVKKWSNHPKRVGLSSHESQRQNDSRQRQITVSSVGSDADDQWSGKVSEREIKLVDAVFNNISYMDTSSDDYFWQRIAYEMARYENPLNDCARAKWKRLFSDLLEEAENEKNSGSPGQFIQLFKSRDLSPFEQINHAQENRSPEKETKDHSRVSITSFESPSLTKASTLNQNSSTPKKPSKATSAGDYGNKDTDILADQLVLVTVFANRFEKNEISPEFWQLLAKDLEEAGRITRSEIDLEQYFKKLSYIQLEIMKTSMDTIEAVKKWPLFKVLNDLDLSHFLEDKWTYRRLKSKFQ